MISARIPQEILAFLSPSPFPSSLGGVCGRNHLFFGAIGVSSVASVVQRHIEAGAEGASRDICGHFALLSVKAQKRLRYDTEAPKTVANSIAEADDAVAIWC